MQTTSKNVFEGTIWIFLAIICLGNLVLSGCSDSGFLETYPATGRISFNGKPLPGALLIFHPINPDEKLKRAMPKAKVAEDGSFTVYTYKKDDGAPVQVTVVWPNGPDEMDQHPGYIPDQFYGRFANTERSNLQVTIKPEYNEISEIQLR